MLIDDFQGACTVHDPKIYCGLEVSNAMFTVN